MTGPRSWPDGAVGRVLSHRGASTRCRAFGEPETGVVAEDSPLEEPLDGDGEGDEGTSLAAARGLLLAVPVLWATYNPALRFIYDSPTSPTPAELTSVRMLAAMVPFTAVFLSIARDAASTFGEDGVVDLSDERKDSDKVRDVRLLLRAGAELGLLNFLGTACQAWGLEQTTATRAGFLLSTINVGVPLFAAAGLGGVNAPPVTGPAWAACALALLGVLITDYSADLSGVQPGDGFNAGDLGVLAAAVCYATRRAASGSGIRRPGGFGRREARGDVPVLRRVGAGGSGELRRWSRRGLAQRRAVGERAVGRRVQRGCVGGGWCTALWVPALWPTYCR